MNDDDRTRIALTIATAVEEEFLRFEKQPKPPSLETMRALVATAVYRKAFEQLQLSPP